MWLHWLTGSSLTPFWLGIEIAALEIWSAHLPESLSTLAKVKPLRTSWQMSQRNSTLEAARVATHTPSSTKLGVSTLRSVQRARHTFFVFAFHTSARPL